MPEFTALTDLATCRAVAGITDPTQTGDDALLTSLLASVSASISTYCNRNFGTASYTETYNGDGSQFVWLNQRPVTAVSSVTIDGLAATQRPSGQPTAYGWTFDANKLYFTGDYFSEGFQNIVVVYTAGLSISSTNFPDLWRAAAEWVVSLYKGQQHIDKKSDGGLEGQNTTYLGAMPWSVKIVVDKYRQIAPVQSLGI